MKRTTNEEQTTPKTSESKRRKTAHRIPAPNQAHELLQGHRSERPTPGGAFTYLPDGRVVYKSSVQPELEQHRQTQRNAFSTYTQSSRSSNAETSRHWGEIPPSLSTVQTQQQLGNGEKAIQKRRAEQPNAPARSSIGYLELPFECGICGQQYIRRSDFTRHSTWLCGIKAKLLEWALFPDTFIEKKHQVEQMLVCLSSAQEQK